MPIRVVFIEDNASLRRRFEQQFALIDDIDLVATFATAEGALRGMGKMPPEERPEIALMDIELPGMSGVEATIAMRELFPATDVLMFTVFEDEEKIFRSIQAGAAGYMLKDAPITRVAEAIRELHGGGSPMSQSIARTVMS
jgi:DNA-binding NarL/FixJ family response regulator